MTVRERYDRLTWSLAMASGVPWSRILAWLRFEGCLAMNMPWHALGSDLCMSASVSGDKADAISAGSEPLPGNRERHLRYQVPLVLRGYIRGITAGIHQPGQHIVTIGKPHAACIAQLNGSGLPAVINGRGQQLLQLVWLEHRSITGLRHCAVC